MSGQYYTPQRYFPSPQNPSTSSSRPGAAPQSTATGTGFTPTMRDRQARGKDPYSPHDSPSDSDMDFDAVDSPSARGNGVGRLGHLGSGGGGGGGGGAASSGVSGNDGDSFEERRQKLFAIEILDDPEKLAMYACSRGDSIPGTRLHFTRILCGLDQDAGPQQQDPRKASSSRRDPRRRSAGGERVGRH
ncbi:uncharacterized protein CTRU02_203839 [Colletotrichum truncatum]|uniref:Uncharacterized protein n=1 Tax=Colletotrichum truncatum TaxID=5467 RepID=A0ACC3ZAF0_COLTU|nr:uncharacterized protein CTRU02_04170 [Colletotrichum truncatum]KAF6796209.1 hypothetical protein CTRU02_04170 [Colletotrichum truncatum]